MSDKTKVSEAITSELKKLVIEEFEAGRANDEVQRRRAMFVYTELLGGTDPVNKTPRITREKYNLLFLSRVPEHRSIYQLRYEVGLAKGEKDGGSDAQVHVNTSKYLTRVRDGIKILDPKFEWPKANETQAARKKQAETARKLQAKLDNDPAFREKHNSEQRHIAKVDDVSKNWNDVKKIAFQLIGERQAVVDANLQGKKLKISQENLDTVSSQINVLAMVIDTLSPKLPDWPAPKRKVTKKKVAKKKATKKRS